jgi:hypothetical protein
MARSTRGDLIWQRLDRRSKKRYLGSENYAIASVNLRRTLSAFVLVTREAIERERAVRGKPGADRTDFLF